MTFLIETWLGLKVVTWTPLVLGVGAALWTSRIANSRLISSNRSVSATLHPALGQRARWVRNGVVSLLALVTGHVVVLAIGFMVVGINRVRRQRNRSRRSSWAITSELAALIDLFAVALAGGHNLRTATDQVILWAGGDLGEGVRWCAAQARLGRPLADAYEELPGRLGEQIRPLVAALVAYDRLGAPIGPGLRALAADVRLDRRRQAEIQARQMPVAMLFPLVTCVLPAFMLLTIVPVVADTLTSFELFVTP